jgi:chromosome segregation ATPase
MGLFTRRERPERTPDAVTERLLASLEAAVSSLPTRVDQLESEEFKLSELRRQARNAVRSLERAAANAQEAAGGTNGPRRGVGVHPEPIDPPGPRRNY